MVLFHKTNIELWEDFQKLMAGSDEKKKEIVKDDYKFLQTLRDSPLINHDKTKFYCLGNAFTRVQYNEIEWAYRLFYSMENYLPGDVKEFPAFNYAQNFGAFQQAFSNSAKDGFYFFRAIPDLVFIKSVDSSAATSTAMYVFEEVDLLEIKNGGDKLTIPKHNKAPAAFAQLVAGLHTMAVAKIIKELDKNKVPRDIFCKGLLVNKRTSMFFFQLQANLSELANSEMNVHYSQLKGENFDNELTLPLVCAGIKKLTE